LSKEQILQEQHMAYHEAGHAVVCIVLGHDLQNVTIVPEGQQRGHVQQGDYYSMDKLKDGSTHALQLARQDIMICLAGAIAERRALGHVLGSGDGEDIRLATDWATRLGLAIAVWEKAHPDYLPTIPSDPEVLLHTGKTTAEQVLDASWPAIEALAAALLERKTLTALEVESIMNSAKS
jgi:ATP-dependent Zn protease